MGRKTKEIGDGDKPSLKKRGNHLLQEKQLKRVNTMMKLSESTPQGEYCWPDLYSMATATDSDDRKYLKESARTKRLCQMDVQRNGECWCGALKSNQK